MKILLTLFFLLFSFSALSGEGDVYYCETNKFTTIEKNNIKENQNFKFKFKRTKNEIIFGKGGYFENVELIVNYSAGERFGGGGNYSRFYVQDSIFTLAIVVNVPSDHRINAIVATCDFF